jgi:hypothetical protein
MSQQPDQGPPVTLGQPRYPGVHVPAHRGGRQCPRHHRRCECGAADLARARDRGAHAPDEHIDLRWRGDDLRVAGISYDLGGRIIDRWRDVVGPGRDGRYPLGAYTWTWLPLDN